MELDLTQRKSSLVKRYLKTWDYGLWASTVSQDKHAGGNRQGPFQSLPHSWC